MQGYDALWLPGMDHAGIATQNVVERGSRERGQEPGTTSAARTSSRRSGSGRTSPAARSSARCAASATASTGRRERFTMDEGLSRAVQTIFKRLYDDEPHLPRRADHQLVPALPHGPVATSRSSTTTTRASSSSSSTATRPATTGSSSRRPGSRRCSATPRSRCTPDDERYAHLVGREIELPLTGRRIPVVADDHVDPEFGTGAVKVTPAHDPNDFEIGRRHGLPTLDVMTDEAAHHGHRDPLRRAWTGSRPAPPSGRPSRAGPDRRREAPVPARGRPLLPLRHGGRAAAVASSGSSTSAPLAKAAGDAVRDGRVRIHPEEMEPRWFGWVDNMHDWCISRQLWWGHRIPVWYGPDGEVRLRRPRRRAGPPPTARRCRAGRQDPDVLDTWFSSALWPFSTLGWPERDRRPASASTRPSVLRHRLRHPLLLGRPDDDVRPLRDGRACAVRHRRAARPGARPVRQEDVASPAGNVVDPLDWMDATAPTRCASRSRAAPTRAPTRPISEEWAAGSRNFCTKLWNATRFALLNGATVDGRPAGAGRAVRGRPVDPLPARRRHGPGGRRLRGLPVRQDHRGALPLRLGRGLRLVPRARQAAARRGAARPPTSPGGCSARCFDVVLRLLHPVVPFVTEALWTELTGGESLVVAAWPAVDAGTGHAAAGPGRRGRGGRRCSGWSPRSAGSAPTRGCGPGSASRPGSAGLGGDRARGARGRDPGAGDARPGGRRLRAVARSSPPAP